MTKRAHTHRSLPSLGFYHTRSLWEPPGTLWELRDPHGFSQRSLGVPLAVRALPRGGLGGRAIYGRARLEATSTAEIESTVPLGDDIMIGALSLWGSSNSSW